MTKPKHRSALMNDRIQLPLNFDVDRMQVEVHALDLDSFVEYNVLPLKSPAYLVESMVKQTLYCQHPAYIEHHIRSAFRVNSL